jgi:hypothetical protein
VGINVALGSGATFFNGALLVLVLIILAALMWERFREPLNMFTGVLALATLALVYVSVLQWRTLDKTDETMRAGERAFVFVKMFQLGVVNDVQKITPMLENSGSTPANPLHWWISYKKTGVEGLPTNFKYPDFDTQGSEIVGKGNGITTYLGPHQTIYAETISIPITAMKDVREGRARVFVWGWLEYVDTFQTTLVHRTEFCQEINVVGTGSYDANGKASSDVGMRFCGTHNTMK